MVTIDMMTSPHHDDDMLHDSTTVTPATPLIEKEKDSPEVCGLYVPDRVPCLTSMDSGRRRGRLVLVPQGSQDLVPYSVPLPLTLFGTLVYDRHGATLQDTQ